MGVAMSQPVAYGCGEQQICQVPLTQAILKDVEAQFLHTELNDPEAVTREPSEDASLNSTTGSWLEVASTGSQEGREAQTFHLDDTIAAKGEECQQGRYRKQKGWRGLPSKVKKHLQKHGIDGLFWASLLEEENVPADLKERVEYAFRRKEELQGQFAAPLQTRSSAMLCEADTIPDVAVQSSEHCGRGFR